MGGSILKYMWLAGMGVLAGTALGGRGALALSCPPPGAGTCTPGFSDFINLSTSAGFAMRVPVLTEAQEAAGTLTAPFSITVPAAALRQLDPIIEGSTLSDVISYNAFTVSGTFTSDADTGGLFDFSEPLQPVLSVLFESGDFPAGVSDRLRYDLFGGASTATVTLLTEADENAGTTTVPFTLTIPATAGTLSEGLFGSGTSDTVSLNQIVITGSVTSSATEPTGLFEFEGGNESFDIVTVTADSCSSCPEPASLLILGSGLLGVIVHRRRARRSSRAAAGSLAEASAPA